MTTSPPDEKDSLTARLEAAARALGPISQGGFRVMVLEPDLRVTNRDFLNPEELARYMIDLRWETSGDQRPVFRVFDSQFRCLEEA